MAVTANQNGLSDGYPRRGIDALLKHVGHWLMHRQSAIKSGQWAVVGIYLVLVTVPAFLPMPPKSAHIWTNLTLFAQFAFWGIWWPFVLLSMIVVGRLWCGLICPEGTLSEFASAHGKAHGVPRWITWRGWPFVAFAGTTVYGQMVSVYQYAGPALLVLGGSTLGAIVVGFLYGRSKRVWCRYLCPVNGVFGLLSKLAPVHFAVDHNAWRAWPKHRGTRAATMNCAPLVPIRTMQGNSLCHMCGRCSGFRDAVTLSRRSPNFEIVHVAGNDPKPVETILIVFGLIGIAFGAFHWSSTALYIDVKQFLAEWLPRSRPDVAARTGRALVDSDELSRSERHAHPARRGCPSARHLRSCDRDRRLGDALRRGHNACSGAMVDTASSPLDAGPHTNCWLRCISGPLDAHSHDAAWRGLCA